MAQSPKTFEDRKVFARKIIQAHPYSTYRALNREIRKAFPGEPGLDTRVLGQLFAEYGIIKRKGKQAVATRILAFDARAPVERPVSTGRRAHDLRMVLDELKGHMQDVGAKHLECTMDGTGRMHVTMEHLETKNIVL